LVWGLQKYLRKEKYDLVITARNETKLNELANEIKNKNNVNVKVLAIDLSKQYAGEKFLNADNFIDI